MAKRSLKIAFFSPYLTDHLGGGEKHLLDVAEACVQLGHSVSMCIPETFTADQLHQLQEGLELQFGCKPQRFEWVESPLYQKSFSVRKLLWTRRFDIIYFVTDGSLFLSLAKKNILHIQVPFTTTQSGLFNRLKLRSWHVLQTNSHFTRQVIERHWRHEVNQVLYPVVDEAFFHPTSSKRPVILSVGRFFRHLHSKRQDVLVSAFRQLIERVPEAQGWQLLMVGTVEDEAYFSTVKQAASDLPIIFKTRIDKEELRECFASARIYWHAAGFEQDEENHPELVEHFGISTLEAMASGTVPLAVGKGGQREILAGPLEDLQWQTVEELVTKTRILLRSDTYYKRFQAACQKRARHYDYDHFFKCVQQLVEQP